MKHKYPGLNGIACIFGMLFLILDSHCAAQSVQEAIKLCLTTIVPSLFPLFVLSGVLVGASGNFSLPFLSKWFGFPNGGDSIFLLGLLGGFPMGAQCIAQAVESDTLDKHSGERILGVCNNCGPAFLFGILGPILGEIRFPLALFLIQAEAACLTALIWPGKSRGAEMHTPPKINLSQAVSRAARSMVSICSWVILARVILGYLRRWLFPFLPPLAQIIFTGILELTGGCLALAEIPSIAQRFLLSCGFVCFGGISVLLQIQGLTASVGISVKICVAQKLVQSIIGVILGCLYLAGGFLPLLIVVPGSILLKKTVENSQLLMYNSPNKGGI